MLGAKAHPVVFDEQRGVIGANFYCQYWQYLGSYFEPWGQYSVIVPSRVEVTVLVDMLGFEEACTVLSFDGSDVFNSIYHHLMLHTLADMIPGAM